MIIPLAQRHGGNEDVCLFCVYGLSDDGGISLMSVSPTVNSQNKSITDENSQEGLISCHVFIFLYLCGTKRKHNYTVLQLNRSCNSCIVHRGAEMTFMVMK